MILFNCKKTENDKYVLDNKQNKSELDKYLQ